MALAVTIRKGIDPLLRGREVPRKQWRALVLERAEFCRAKFKHDCRHLLFFVADGRENDFFGYPDEETYLRKGLYLDPLTVSVVADYLRTHGEQVGISFDAVLAADAAQRANKRPRGGDHRSNVYKEKKNVHIEQPRPSGNSLQAVLRRLEARPDIHARVLAGELSPNAGMIEAGFRKPPQSRKQSAFQRIEKLLPKLTMDECEELKARLDKMTRRVRFA